MFLSTIVGWKKKWVKRKTKEIKLGRVYPVHPSQMEAFCLRILLFKVPGPKSYEDLRTIENVLYDDAGNPVRIERKICGSFQEACKVGMKCGGHCAERNWLRVWQGTRQGWVCAENHVTSDNSLSPLTLLTLRHTRHCYFQGQGNHPYWYRFTLTADISWSRGQRQ